MSLFSPDHCEGKVVYWAKQYLEVPIRIDHFGMIRFDVELDGKKLVALLDTGASHSILDKEAAQRLFNISALEDQGQALVAGVGVPASSYPFKRLTIDGLTMRDPKILIGSAPATDKIYVAGNRYFGDDDVDADLVLGLNELQFLHIYVAIRERKLYLTPASGS
jgi:hypothetical protein